MHGLLTGIQALPCSRWQVTATPRSCVRTLRTAAAAGKANEPGNGSEQGRQQGAGDDPGHQQQQQQSQWGSGWARRPTGQPGKASSYFSRSSAPAAGDGSSRVGGGAAAAPDAAAAQQQQQEEAVDPQLEASIRANVDRAAATLQEIIDEVLKEVFIEQAAEYVMEGRPGEQQDTTANQQQQQQQPQQQEELISQAVRGAVAKRLEWLDSNFLAALNAYLALPALQHQPELTGLLAAIRQEVLSMVASRLPPAVQVLDAALAHSSRQQRLALLRASLAGGVGGLPGCSLDGLGAAANQLVDDMEEQQVVADRVLLARLVLLREELRGLALAAAAAAADAGAWAAAAAAGDAGTSSGATAADGTEAAAGAAGSEQQEGGGSGSQFFTFHRSNLPARAAAMIKELLAVRERQRRLGLISKAFEEDWIGELGGSSSTSSSEPAQQQQQQQQQRRRGLRDVRQAPTAESSGRAGAGDGGEAPDVVRPGGFLSTLAAMTAELERQVVAAPGLYGSSSGSGNGSSGSLGSLALLGELEGIRREALVALDRLQRRRPGADEHDGGGSGLTDYELDLEDSLPAGRG